MELIPFISSIANPNAELISKVKMALDGVQFSDLVNDEEIAAEEARGKDVLALMVTGGTEHLAMAASRTALSMLILYHDSLNSLPAAIEASSALKVPIVRYDDMKSISAFISACNERERLRAERFTFFGDPSPWLIYSSSSDLKRLGLKVKVVNMDEFINKANSEEVDDDEIREVMGRAPVEGPSRADFITSMKIERAIRKEINGSKLFSIRCFDLLGPLKGTACLALSRLNDEGYTAGCEGDAPAAISMHILSGLSGKPAFMGNIANANGNEMTIAHCTSPTSILSNFKYMTHFESGLGVGIGGSFKEETEMTVLRMDRDFKLMRYGVGNVVKTEWRNDLCRTQVTLKFHGDPSIVIRKPIGNHYAVVPGNYERELEFLSSMLDIELQSI